MSNNFVEVVTEEDLQRRVKELAAEIEVEYRDRDPVLVGVLAGSTPFLADLSRAMDIKLSVDFLALTRFGEEGKVSIAMDTLGPLAGRHVILVEDIVDTGLTLATLRRLLEARGLASLEVVTLLDKAPRRIIDVALEYRGFEIGDEFLLGYGLDWEGKYRNLRSLWAVLDIGDFQENPAALATEVFTGAGDRLGS